MPGGRREWLFDMAPSTMLILGVKQRSFVWVRLGAIELNQDLL
jgi:hypothetical protein